MKMQHLRRGLRSSSRVAFAPRIMSSDRVPGVKTVSGEPVRQKVNAEATAGAEALKAAVNRQKAARSAERQEAQAISSLLAKQSAIGGGSNSSSDVQQAVNVNGVAVATTTTTNASPQLSFLRESLDSSIDGQSLAKDVVARSLRRRSMKLDDGERPLRLLFAGPSGVGKTAMATALCEALLGSCIPDRNFKRFNLSEFSHPSKFNRLTGGDPNYVGYKEGGELTNFIRNAEERRVTRATGIEHTSCVLLLDEVDRAAEGLLTFLMNFLDQGQLTSGAGDMVDARRAVVLMTTNVGQGAIAAAKSAQEGLSVGAAWDADEAKKRRGTIVESIRSDVLKHVCDGRYENLGRLGTIVPFLPLQDGGRKAVVERQLQSVGERLGAAGAAACLDGWSDGLVEHALQYWDDDVGGRSTRDFIEENVVEAIADAIDAHGGGSTGTARGTPPLKLRLHAEQGRVVCGPAGD